MAEEDIYRKNPEDERRVNPASFPVGSAFRRHLEKHGGIIPPLSDDKLRETVEEIGGFERADLLTPSLDPQAYKIKKEVEERVGLPDLPIYIMDGEEWLRNNGFFNQDWGAVFIGRDYLQSPGRFEGVLLHEIGHGFQDVRIKHGLSYIVECMEKVGNAVEICGFRPLMAASTILSTPATTLRNVINMADELDADKFGARNADGSQVLANLTHRFRIENPKTASYEEGRSPLTALSVALEGLSFLLNVFDRGHPPTSIRYALAAREVARLSRHR